MKLGTENKKQVIAAACLGVVALIAIIYVISQLTGGSSPAPPPAPVITVAPTTGTTAPVGKAAHPIATTNGELDPTLKMDAMLTTEALEYSGGRNIFSRDSAPPIVVQKPIAPVHPVETAPIQTGPPPPPPPPSIELKFFGTFTRKDGVLHAYLLHGDDVFLAAPGDIVNRRYRVVAITQNTIKIEDIPNNNTQTLPLASF